MMAEHPRPQFPGLDLEGFPSLVCLEHLCVNPSFWKRGRHILVLADDDQVLAAEPGYHCDPPKGGGTGAMSIRRFSDHGGELLEQQPKNVPAQGAAFRLAGLDVVAEDGGTLPADASV